MVLSTTLSMYLLCKCDNDLTERSAELLKINALCFFATTQGGKEIHPLTEE